MSDVIQKVCYVRVLYHVDHSAVEAFAGTNRLEHATKVLESGCSSQQNPLKLKFNNGTYNFFLGGYYLFCSACICSIPIACLHEC